MRTPTQLLKLRSPSQPQQSRQVDNVAAVLNPVATALAVTPIMGAAPPSWIRPSYNAGFKDNLSGYAPTAYHKDALGYVWLRVALTSPGGSAANFTPFTLDMDYRPAGKAAIIGVEDTTGAAALITIAPSGVVTVGVAVGAFEGILAYGAFLAGA